MAQTWSVIRGDVETQISGGTLSYRVSATNIGAPPKRTIATRGVFQNGQSFYGFRYSKRILSLVFFADAASLALADAMRDDIYELWRGSEGQTVTLKVTRDDGAVRLIDGEVVNVIDFPDAVGDRYGASQRFTVQLECHNPFWRGQSLVVKNITVNGTSTLTYDGQYPTEPIINIVGPITNPVLTQVFTGKKLDFTGTTIAAGDNYQIDTRYGYKTVLDGSFVNRIANLTSDSNLADFTHETFTPTLSRRWAAVSSPLESWWSVAYGNGVWVAVAANPSALSADDLVMRSTDDGLNWSSGAAANPSLWVSVAYGNGVWVSVAYVNFFAGPIQMMRSTDDGVTWSSVSVTEANIWTSVAYGNGVWVAVAGTGTNRVMRSTNDGVSWSAVAATEANFWQSVAYGNGIWIAVSIDGTNRVMRSTDGGATWSAVAAAEANSWLSVAYGNSVWVAVASTGTNRVMRSTNGGVTWSAVAAAEANSWRSVAYGNGVWVAISSDGTNRVMRSTDNGVTWDAVAATEANIWMSVAYGNSVWVAVASSGTNLVMRSTEFAQQYTLTGTSTTGATTVTMTYNNVFLGI